MGYGQMPLGVLVLRGDFGGSLYTGSDCCQQRSDSRPGSYHRAGNAVSRSVSDGVSITHAADCPDSNCDDTFSNGGQYAGQRPGAAYTDAAP